MLSEQIAHRVIVDIESGCWEWQGSKDPVDWAIIVLLVLLAIAGTALWMRGGV